MVSAAEEERVKVSAGAWKAIGDFFVTTVCVCVWLPVKQIKKIYLLCDSVGGRG
jgi:hypothetical protein